MFGLFCRSYWPLETSLVPQTLAQNHRATSNASHSARADLTSTHVLLQELAELERLLCQKLQARGEAWWTQVFGPTFQRVARFFLSNQALSLVAADIRNGQAAASHNLRLAAGYELLSLSPILRRKLLGWREAFTCHCCCHLNVDTLQQHCKAF